MESNFVPCRVSWRRIYIYIYIYSDYVHTDISGYLQHPSDNELSDGLILRCTDFDAGYKLQYVFQMSKHPP